MPDRLRSPKRKIDLANVAKGIGSFLSGFTGAAGEETVTATDETLAREFIKTVKANTAAIEKLSRRFSSLEKRLDDLTAAIDENTDMMSDEDEENET